jgi:putative FmdB family regulatory protein
MPLYEYQCGACGHRFEKIQKYSDPIVEECPKCGELKVSKLVSSPAIQFKGTGWYITDYAKKNTVDSSKSGDARDGDGKGGEAKGGDAKGGDSKSTDAKTGDAKSGDSKTSDSKSSESKSADSKSSETKSTASSS